jgi:uncharacterized protein YegL
MESIRSDAVGGFNTFIEGQRQVPGTASVTVVLFDDRYELLYENIDLQTVKNLTDETFVPRGMTALLDAVGRTINEVGIRLDKTPEDQRPEKVMICIVTDGQENFSHEFQLDKIKEMISHQRDKYSWEFCFLAANQDAFATAGGMGVSKQYTSNFAATSAGVRGAYGCAGVYATQYRTK